jgi:hypothetical protein
LGTVASFRGLLSVLLVAAAAYGLGRYVRPSPPPLIIQRLPNSPLSDTPVDPNHLVQSNGNSSARSEPNPNQPNSEEEVYICGARTQKGKPCRRRVHTLGDRCFQHKGLPAMVSLEKLVIKPGK